MLSRTRGGKDNKMKQSFNKALDYFTEDWGVGRKDGIKKLENIRDEIQKQARILSIGSITYSSVGIVGGGLTIAGIIAAPFTFGVSLGLTVAGIATGVTSGVAGVTHGAIKSGIVTQLCKDAKIFLDKHEISCNIMRYMLKELKEEVEVEKNKNKNDLIGGANDLARVIKLGTALADIIPSAAKDVSKGAAKLSTKALSVTVAIGIVIDFTSLIINSVDLSNFNNGKLCPEAQKVQNVIDQMEREYNVVAKIFE